MGKIIYYSNYCENSKKVINKIAKTELVKSIHFICIDKRNIKNNKTYIILESNQEVLLPETITRVPALLLLNEDFKVYFGQDILEYLKPIEKISNNKATLYQGEPENYNLNNQFGYGVVSDNYSFLDQTSQELSAKGGGGMRQIHNYATLDHKDSINTPAEDYTPDKIGEFDMDKINNERNYNLN